jgi:hypothetical protein
MQNGATASEPGKVNQAFRFDGTNDFVVISDSPVLSPHVGATGAMTVEAWFRMDEYPRFDTGTGQTRRALVAKGTPGEWEYALYVRTNGNVAFSVWNPAGTGYAEPEGIPASLHEWHHLAGTLKKGEFARVYLDGVLVAEEASFVGDTADGVSPLYIGRRGDGQYFNGWVDEVALYDRVLSDAEITAIYAAGSAGICTSSPPSIVAQPLSQTVAVGTNVTLSVVASGLPAPQYQWFYDGNVIGGANASSLSLANIDVARGGGYRVVVSNPYGAVTSSVATLTVQQAPTITQQPESQTAVACSCPILDHQSPPGSPCQ